MLAWSLSRQDENGKQGISGFSVCSEFYLPHYLNSICNTGGEPALVHEQFPGTLIRHSWILKLDLQRIIGRFRSFSLVASYFFFSIKLSTQLWITITALNVRMQLQHVVQDHHTRWYICFFIRKIIFTKVVNFNVPRANQFCAGMHF